MNGENSPSPRIVVESDSNAAPGFSSNDTHIILETYSNSPQPTVTSSSRRTRVLLEFDLQSLVFYLNDARIFVERTLSSNNAQLSTQPTRTSWSCSRHTGVLEFELQSLVFSSNASILVEQRSLSPHDAHILLETYWSTRVRITVVPILFERSHSRRTTLTPSSTTYSDLPRTALAFSSSNAQTLLNQCSLSPRGVLEFDLQSFVFSSNARILVRRTLTLS
ncbi:hypothetical protein K474DRAFT_875884 [Panus rudis PR-1116 ss-1]|nr:hypothetical protein K474DRAFT_875884 [Panus rudis PR-1116 ss-1]